MRITAVAFYMFVAMFTSLTHAGPAIGNNVGIAADAELVQHFAKEFQKVRPAICKMNACVTELRLQGESEGEETDLVIRLERPAEGLDAPVLSIELYSPTKGWLILSDKGIDGSIDIFMVLTKSDSSDGKTHTLHSCYDISDQLSCGIVRDQFSEISKVSMYTHAVSTFLKVFEKISKKIQYT